jgi:hypothetical protein
VSPLNSSNVDSQGIKFELNISNKTAKIIGYENSTEPENDDVNADIIIKRGVKDINGVVYKVTSMTDDCLSTVTSIASITFNKTNINEFTYIESGFPTNLDLVQFKDEQLLLNPPP